MPSRLKTNVDSAEPSLEYENRAREAGYRYIAGIDEAGRGPLAGPVVAAACYMPANVFVLGVDDSKKLSPKRREEIFKGIVNHPDIVYGIGVIGPDVIDSINIYQATIQAMLMAVQAMPKQPDYLLVDGLKLPHPTIPSEKIIGGDRLSHLIAAASILAKVTRDSLMRQFDLEWPQYGFRHHMGYSTAEHLAALAAHGPCRIHRFSYAPVKEPLPLPEDKGQRT